MRIVVILFAFALLGCDGCRNSKDNTLAHQPTQEDLIAHNKAMHLEETQMVHDFIKDKKWPMTETGTGLNYWIYENGTGAKAELEMFATISYTVSNFDGVEIYKSEPANPGMFKIGMDNVESGLHEVIVLMKVGDKAKVVLPSHLAFGLTGDSSKIPHSTPLVYDIQLIDLQ